MTDKNITALVVSHLLSGKTLSATAKLVGVSVKTLSRLRKTEEFRNEYSAAKRELVRSVVDQLAVNAAPAVATLKRIFSDRRASSAARVNASATTIRLTLEGYELQELANRIDALENAINAQTD